MNALKLVKFKILMITKFPKHVAIDLAKKIPKSGKKLRFYLLFRKNKIFFFFLIQTRFKNRFFFFFFISQYFVNSTIKFTIHVSRSVKTGN